jgi:lipid-A-disaccharide synthase
MMPKQVMIIAGEASGEQHAAQVVNQLKKAHPDWVFCGMGGTAMRAACVETFIDIREMAVMGIVEVVGKLPVILSALKQVKKRIVQDKPDVIILVDYAGFNLKVAKFAKQQGIKVFYYISPKVWAWKASRIQKIKRYVDHIAVIMPFEEAIYQRAGVPVTYVGSPSVAQCQQRISQQSARKTLSLDEKKPVIGFLPGSRQSEITRLMPLMLQVADVFPDAQFVLALAPNLTIKDLDHYKASLKRLDIHVVQEMALAVCACDAVVCASGTATLDVALLGVPMVVVYKMASLTFWLAKRLVTLENVSLCNLIAGKKIVQEYLQKAATAQAVSTELKRLLDDGDYRQKMCSAFDEVKQSLTQGPPSAEQVAHLIEQMVG